MQIQKVESGYTQGDLVPMSDRDIQTAIADLVDGNELYIFTDDAIEGDMPVAIARLDGSGFPVIYSSDTE